MPDEILTTPITLTRATHFTTGWVLFQGAPGGFTARCQLVLKDADGGKAVRTDVLDLGAAPAALAQDINRWVQTRLIALGQIT